MVLLSLIVFAPAVVAIALALLSAFTKLSDDLVRFITFAVTFGVFLGTLGLLVGESAFDLSFDRMQYVFSVDWISSFDIFYFVGLDGISLPLVVLTSFISMLAMGASWSIKKHVTPYCVLFLLLETGMLGVFMALDFFLFYVFWEVMLLPMYFLIGIWGGSRKEYAAIKFFLYTLVGSVLMLIAILMLYFNSDLTQLTVDQMRAANVIAADAEGDAIIESLTRLGFSETQAQAVLAGGGAASDDYAVHTFNILAMAQMGQHTTLFDDELLFGWTLQHWAFVLLFIGFIIKVPSVPVHTWLPDAHVEAPTPISMILAGVLLKMGGYGIIRMCYPICPHAGYDFAYVVCLVGVISMVYGAFAAMAQSDFKRLVAYSSVSHMGYVVLGFGVWSASAGTLFNADYWNMGIKGAMFQMIAHGISSAGMFFMVGVVYDRVHHRNLNEFGGLYGRMPVYTGMAMVIFFAGLGLPGLCGFIGEVFVVLSVWKFNQVLAIISAAVVILTAGYILWAIQRVYLGAEYKGPHGEALSRINFREFMVALPLVVLAVVFGVFPHQTLIKYMDTTIDRQTYELAEWTKNVKEPSLAKQREEIQGNASAKTERKQSDDLSHANSPSGLYETDSTNGLGSLPQEAQWSVEHEILRGNNIAQR